MIQQTTNQGHCNKNWFCLSGISELGRAKIDSLGSTCNITIKGSDNPHGVFKISKTSKKIKVKESVGKVEIIIDRLFGTIGNVRVLYSLNLGLLCNLI